MRQKDLQPTQQCLCISIPVVRRAPALNPRKFGLPSSQCFEYGLHRHDKFQDSTDERVAGPGAQPHIRNLRVGVEPTVSTRLPRTGLSSCLYHPELLKSPAGARLRPKEYIECCYLSVVSRIQSILNVIIQVYMSCKYYGDQFQQQGCRVLEAWPRVATSSLIMIKPLAGQYLYN